MNATGRGPGGPGPPARPGPPPRRQTLTFPEDVASPPRERGMSGRFLSGDKPHQPRGGGGGGTGNGGPAAAPSDKTGSGGALQVPNGIRFPPPRRRSGSIPQNGFQPLPLDGGTGAFDLYGQMDTSSMGSVTPMSSLKPTPVPKRALPQAAKKAGKGNKGSTSTQALRSIDKAPKSKKLPSAKPVLPDIASQYDRMLMGHLDNLPLPLSTTIRIFLSSTFSDFKSERNYFINNAYPQLREYCQIKGLDFQVVDLRWGISDSSTNDHTVEDICLSEIANCQRLSPGPNFILMVGNRHGFQPIPTVIAAEEFETLRRLVSDGNLLSTWYRQDENAIPAVYVLQNITTFIPEYEDEDEEKRTEGRKTWQKTLQQLQEALRSAAMKAHAQQEIDEKRLREYHWSVTENEAKIGILDTKYPESSCIAIFRTLDDIDLNHPLAPKFKEITKVGGTPTVNEDAAAMLKQFRKKVSSKLPNDNKSTFTIKWKDGGIKASDPQHASYLKSVSDDLVTKVKSLIDNQVGRLRESHHKQVTHTVSIPKPEMEENNTKPSQKGAGKGRASNRGVPQTPFGHAFSSDANAMADLMRGKMVIQGVVEEHKAVAKGTYLGSEATIKIQLHASILHHLTFCRRRVAHFCGRHDELEFVHQYLTSPDMVSPLVISSPTGGGKTSFMAKVVSLSKTWLGEQTVVIARFLGSSPCSSDLLTLLGNLCSHIALAYREALYSNAMTHIGAVQRHFMDLIELVSLSYGPRRPLLLVLDSIEGLSSIHSPHLLHWLPKLTSPYIKILISLTPEINDGLEHARTHLQTGDTFHNLHLQPLTPEDATSLITAYPKHHNRTLTEKQHNKLTMKAETLPSPLLLKLWLDEACLWKSYTTNLALPGTVTEAIRFIFDRLIQKFGRVFVTTALGYMAICLEGISEVELENALSTNDDVMNEVYNYHNPPIEGIVILPPLMWKRLLTDLQEYIVENQMPDRTVLKFYHRQFYEVAVEKYAQGRDGEMLHAGLASIFLVEERFISTIFLKQRNLKIKDANRLVAPQPLTPKNIRKLTAVCYHLSKSGDVDRFKQEVLCNLKFLECLYQGIFNKRNQSLHAVQIWQIFENIDEESLLVVNALRLINPLIRQNIGLLPVQLLNQLVSYTKHHPHIASLCSQAGTRLRESKVVSLLPVVGNVGNEGSPVNWYFEGPTRIINQSQDGSTLLIAYKSGQHNDPLCTVFDVSSSCETHAVLKLKSLKRDILYSGLLSRNNRRAYLLCRENYVIYSILDGGKSKTFTASNNVNGAGSLHECLVASRNDKLFVLAGPSRLAMFEDKSANFDEPDFKVRRAMNFAGSKSTTNVIFSEDEMGSISTHTIQGQKRVSGAIARWTFASENPCDKLGLPEPVPPGCLQRLPGISQPDCVLVACADGKLYTVSMSSCSILMEFKNTVGLRGKSLLLDLHPDGKCAVLGCREQTAVAFYDLGEEKMTGHVELQQNAQSLRIGPDKDHLTVLQRDGTLKVFDLGTTREVASVNAHNADATSLFCPDDGHVLTCAYDKTLKQFELRRMLSKGSTKMSNSNGTHVEYVDVDNYQIVDNSTVLTGHNKSSPRLWSIPSGQELGTMEPATVGSGVTAILTKSNRIMSLDQSSKTLKHWECPSGKPVKLLPGIKDVLFMVAAGDESLVVLVCEFTPGTMIFVYNPNTNQEMRRIFIPDKIPKSAQPFLSKNAHFLIMLLEKFEKDDDDKEVRISGVLSVDLTKAGDQDPSWLDKDVTTLTTLDSELFVLYAEKEILVWQPPKTAGLYNMAKYGNWLKHAVLIQQRDECVTQMTASDDDRQLATATVSGSIALWENALKSELADKMKGILLKKHINSVTSLKFSPCGKYLVSGSLDKTLILWDTAKAMAIQQLHTHARVLDINFPPDGSSIIAILKGPGSSRIGVWSILGSKNS